MTTATDVQSLYIAYFNRPADPLGLAYWTDQVDNHGQSLTSVANNFSLQPEYTAAYAGLSTAQVVNQIYVNLFGHGSDLPGLQYWVSQLNSGAVTVGKLALSVLNGATGADATAVTSKESAAASFTASVDTTPEVLAYNGSAANSIAKAWLSTVVDSASATAAIGTKDATISSISNILVTSGTTTALTTGQDTLTGTDGNDVFNAGALNGGTGTLVDSLQNVDAINGGAGTDTLNVTLNGTATVAPSLTSVENIVLRSTNSSSALDLVAATGVMSVSVANSTQAATVNNVRAASLAVANQATNVTFNGSTATTQNLSLDTVGTSSSAVSVTINNAGTAATTLALTANNSFANVVGVAAKTVSIAATGSNVLGLGAAATSATTLTVTGSGFVDVSGANLAAATTVTAGDGGLKATITNATAQAVTVTTGAGADTISAVGAGVKSISTGAGNDKVTVATSALGATATIDLGAGDDTITFGAAFATGATIAGGVGTDTIGLLTADYATVSAYIASDLAKVTGFEVLSISDALGAAAYDVSKIAGIGSFVAAAGITAATAASVTNLGANASVTLAGAATTGTISLGLKTDTSADVLNLVLKNNFAQNNDGVADVATATQGVTASTIETLNVNSTGKASATVTTGAKVDTITNTLNLTDDALTTLNITGNQKLIFASKASEIKLATIDATANTAGVSIDTHLAATDGTAAALTIKGSLTASNTIVGTGNADVIVGGAKADVITGGAGGDTLTGGGGNNTFKYAAGDSTIVAGKADTITDFHANTFGAGLNGAVTAAGASGVAAASLTGDVLNITHLTTANNGVTVGVYTNASDAQTFLQTQSATEGVAANQTVHAALNSTTGDLYLDIDGNGTVDLYIHLTGVTTLNAAAFIIA